MKVSVWFFQLLNTHEEGHFPSSNTNKVYTLHATVLPWSIKFQQPEWIGIILDGGRQAFRSQNDNFLVRSSRRSSGIADTLHHQDERHKERWKPHLQHVLKYVSISSFLLRIKIELGWPFLFFTYGKSMLF
jgi:hypothetical protein